MQVPSEEVIPARFKAGTRAPSRGEYKIVDMDGIDTGETISIEYRGDVFPHIDRDQAYEKVV